MTRITPAVALLVALPTLAGGGLLYAYHRPDKPPQEDRIDNSRASWRVYQSGSALELAVDTVDIWRDAKGLIHFVNQERFGEPRLEKALNVRYSIRRTNGIADCGQYQYTFTNSEYFAASGEHLYSQMFPLQEYNRRWNPVYKDSVAHAMMSVVCELGANAPSKKSK